MYQPRGTAVKATSPPAPGGAPGRGNADGPAAAHEIRRATPSATSVTFVPVGPVTTRSERAPKNGYESLRARCSTGESPAARARAQVAPSAKAPAASVGPSTPSVPAERTAIPFAPSIAS